MSESTVSINDLIDEYINVRKTDETIKRDICGYIVEQRIQDGYVRLKDIRTISSLCEYFERAYGPGFHNFLDRNKQFIHDLERCKVKPYTRIEDHIWIHPIFAIKVLHWYIDELEVSQYQCLFDYAVAHLYEIAEDERNIFGINKSGDLNIDVFRHCGGNVSKDKEKLYGILETVSDEKEKQALQDLIIYIADVFKDSTLGVNIGIEIYKQRKSKNDFCMKLLRQIKGSAYSYGDTKPFTPPTPNRTSLSELLKGKD